jgi:uncharacterized membrane protein
VAYLLVAGALLLTSVVLPATGAFDIETASITTDETVEGTVRSIAREQRSLGPGEPVQLDVITVDLDGSTVTVERQRFAGDAVIEVTAGDRVLLAAAPTPEGTRYLIVERVRRPVLAWLAGAFALAVLVVARGRGIGALVGLAAGALVLVRFVMPAILAGANPVGVSVVGALTIMSTTLFIAHGVNRQTTVALAGTAIALVLTAVLAVVSIEAAVLTGLASEEAAALLALSSGQIDPRGLLLGGIVIGALGVLDDVTTTQTATVFELRRSNAALSSGSLYARGMAVGREHIASTVNTLVLAYAGASLPLLVILAAGTEAPLTLLNRELIATEVVRALVGSIGIVAAVPITTALAAVTARSIPVVLEETTLAEVDLLDHRHVG